LDGQEQGLGSVEAALASSPTFERLEATPALALACVPTDAGPVVLPNGAAARSLCSGPELQRCARAQGVLPLYALTRWVSCMGPKLGSGGQQGL
jgi:hypothetical protein